MKRKTLLVTALGIPEPQRRALISATQLIQSRLPADIEWGLDAAVADIVVIDVAYEPHGECTLSAHAVLLSHAPEGEAPDDGIVRPLRMPQVERCFDKAMKLALQRSEPTPVLETPPEPVAADVAPLPGKSSRQRIYRGRVVSG